MKKFTICKKRKQRQDDILAVDFYITAFILWIGQWKLNLFALDKLSERASVKILSYVVQVK